MVLSVQKLRAFRKRGPLSRFIGDGLTSLFSLVTSNVAYLKQAPEAARNLEMMVEHLLRFGIKEPRKLGAVLLAASDWRSHYYSAQQETKDKPYFLVYTADDHKIPFKPEEDTMYAYMLAQVAYVAHKISKFLSARHLVYIAGCFQELNKISSEVYRNHQTRMPRFTDHNRISLKVVQWLDEPLNCCPSLHIAYSTLLYNIANHVLNLPARDEEAWESVKNSTYGMINSVLYTKQHALVDVAFGILAAKVIFERRFKKHTFNDLMDELPELQRRHPDIPYNKVEDAFHRGKALHRVHEDLASVVGKYLNEKGFPLLKPNGGQFYYDEKRGVVVPINQAQNYSDE